MKLNLIKCAFRVSSGKFFGVHGITEGHRSKPREGQGCPRDGGTENNKTTPMADRKDCGPKLFHITVNRLVPSIL
jgi:hypothetical protein